MRYAVVIERTGAGYSAYVPDLPGCVAAGSELGEVETLIQEAIGLHLTGMKEDGLSIPQPASVVEYMEVAA